MKDQMYTAECVHLTAKRSSQDMTLLFHTGCVHGLPDRDINIKSDTVLEQLQSGNDVSTVVHSYSPQ